MLKERLARFSRIL